MGASWQPEDQAGHAPYCVTPYHSTARYCAGSPDDPPTMRGRPSQAWYRDHPGAPAAPDEDTAGTKLILVSVRVTYTAEVRVPETADAAQAVAKAHETPVTDWDQTWDPPETEEAG